MPSDPVDPIAGTGGGDPLAGGVGTDTIATGNGFTRFEATPRKT